MTSTRGSRRISILSASFTVWIMFITGTGSFSFAEPPRLVALLYEVPGELPVDFLEERFEVGRRRLLGDGDRLFERAIDLGDFRLFLRLGPLAARLEPGAETWH